MNACGCIVPVIAHKDAAAVTGATHRAIIRPRLNPSPAKKSAARAPLVKCEIPKVKRGKLSGKSREKLPDCAFADPEHRAYPIHDATHTKNAWARLVQQRKAGNVDDASFERIRSAIMAGYKKHGLVLPESGKSPDQNKESVPMARKAKQRAKKPMTEATKAKLRAYKSAKKSKKRSASKKPAKSKTKKVRSAPRTVTAVIEPSAPRRTRKRKARRAVAAPATKPRKTRKRRARRAVAAPATKPRKRVVHRKRAVHRKFASAPAMIVKPVRKRPRKARAAGEKPKRTVHRVRFGKYVNTTTGKFITVSPKARHNPPIGVGEVVLAVGGVAAGYGIAELACRYIATMPSDSRATYGAEKPLYGSPAVMAQLAKPSAIQMGATFGGSALFGVAAYLTRNHSLALFGLGGVAAGMFAKTLGLVAQRFIVPLLTTGEAKDDETLEARLFPIERKFDVGGNIAQLPAEDMDFELVNGQYAPKAGKDVTLPAVYRTPYAARFVAGQPAPGMTRGAPRRDFGPVAAARSKSGTTGCGCGCDACCDDGRSNHSRFENWDRSAAPVQASPEASVVALDEPMSESPPVGNMSDSLAGPQRPPTLSDLAQQKGIRFPN